MPAEGTTVLAVLGRGLVPADTPVVRADDAGVTRGDGCFEGCRLQVHPDGGRAVDKLDAHLARMTRSAAALGIPFHQDAWRALVELAADAWRGTGEAAVKLVLTRGVDETPTSYAWITPLNPAYPALRRAGLRVSTLPRGLDSTAFREAPWLLGGVKTLSYAVNMAAAREAERRGVHDVIFVSSDGVVLESPTATVVWSSGRTLHTTPAGATGILPGTTQRLLFERAGDAGWDTRDTVATVDDLHAADVLWLISSVRGPVDVVELAGKARVRMPEVDAEVRTLCGFPPPA